LPNGWEAGYGLQEQLEVLVWRLALTTPGETLTGEKKRHHVFCQIRQRRHRSRKRVVKFTDVITGRYTMLGQHGGHDLERGEHVRLESWKRGSEDVLVDIPDAGQESGV
jgi:hypothetical protein